MGQSLVESMLEFLPDSNPLSEAAVRRTLEHAKETATDDNLRLLMELELDLEEVEELFEYAREDDAEEHVGPEFKFIVKQRDLLESLVWQDAPEVQMFGALLSGDLTEEEYGERWLSGKDYSEGITNFHLGTIKFPDETNKWVLKEFRRLLGDSDFNRLVSFRDFLRKFIDKIDFHRGRAPWRFWYEGGLNNMSAF